MKQLNKYITEKLKINKDSEPNKDTFTGSLQETADIIVSTFAYLLVFHDYKENSVFKKTIYLSKIYYPPIIEFLNEVFGYSFDYTVVTASHVGKTISKNKKTIENILNRYTTSVISDDGKERIELNGKELYKKYDTEEYKSIFNKFKK